MLDELGDDKCKRCHKYVLYVWWSWLSIFLLIGGTLYFNFVNNENKRAWNLCFEIINAGKIYKK